MATMKEVPFVVRGALRFFFFSSRRRHTRLQGDWSSDVCSSDLDLLRRPAGRGEPRQGRERTRDEYARHLLPVRMREVRVVERLRRPRGETGDARDQLRREPPADERGGSGGRGARVWGDRAGDDPGGAGDGPPPPGGGGGAQPPGNQPTPPPAR